MIRINLVQFWLLVQFLILLHSSGSWSLTARFSQVFARHQEGMDFLSGWEYEWAPPGYHPCQVFPLHKSHPRWAPRSYTAPRRHHVGTWESWATRAVWEGRTIVNLCHVGTERHTPGTVRYLQVQLVTNCIFQIDQVIILSVGQMWSDDLVLGLWSISRASPGRYSVILDILVVVSFWF